MARRRRITKGEVTKILYRVISHFHYDDDNNPVGIFHTVHRLGQVGIDVVGDPLVVRLDDDGTPSIDAIPFSLNRIRATEFTDSLDKIDEVINRWKHNFVNQSNRNIEVLEQDLRDERKKLDQHLTVFTNNENIKFKGYGYES